MLGCQWGDEAKCEMAETVFAPTLEGIKHVKSEDGEILTMPFLEVCKHILPAIDKLGVAMAFVKSDIGGHISKKSRRETLLEYVSNVQPEFMELYEAYT